MTCAVAYTNEDKSLVRFRQRQCFRCPFLPGDRIVFVSTQLFLSELRHLVDVPVLTYGDVLLARLFLSSGPGAAMLGVAPRRVEMVATSYFGS